jgi:large subunit ribosomal protein L15
MKVHELQLKAAPDRKRVGRGISAGGGKTAGRGTKGQNSRTGGGVRPGFEGGQNPLAKRLPKKRGFAPLSRTIYQPVNLSSLEALKDGAKLDILALQAAGLVKSATQPVKILGSGELTKKVNLTVQAISKTAQAAVLKAGGSVTIEDLPKAKSNNATRPTSEQQS